MTRYDVYYGLLRPSSEGDYVKFEDIEYLLRWRETDKEPPKENGEYVCRIEWPHDAATIGVVEYDGTWPVRMDGKVTHYRPIGPLPEVKP